MLSLYGGKMKKTVLIGAALVLLSGMIFAGGGNEGNPQEKPNYPPGEPVTLWSQYCGDVWYNHFTKQVDIYNKEGRGYVVTEEFIAQSAWYERITTARASGTAPDGIVQAYASISAGLKDGYFLPLNDLIDKKIIDDMLPVVKTMAIRNGKVYAVPLLIEPSMLLFYRKDILGAKGYRNPPKTWKELADMAVALKNDDMYGLGISPWGPNAGWATWGMQYGAAGHGPLTDNWDKPWIDQGYKDLALFFKELYDREAVPSQPLSEYLEIRPIGQGDYVFQLCGSWAIGNLINYYDEMWPNIGIAPAPTKDGDQKKPTATLGGWTYLIDAKAKSPKGVANYLNWLCDIDNPDRLGYYHVDEKFAKGAPYKTTAKWLEGQVTGAETLEYIKVINDVAAYAKPEPAWPWDISARVATFLEEVAMGYETLDTAYDTCVKDIQALINDNRLAGTNPDK
jgi:multiple sugar transport system substrate-binding protein